MLTLVVPRGRRTMLETERASEALLSWNSRATQGLIEVAAGEHQPNSFG